MNKRVNCILIVLAILALVYVFVISTLVANETPLPKILIKDFIDLNITSNSQKPDSVNLHPNLIQDPDLTPSQVHITRSSLNTTLIWSTFTAATYCSVSISSYVFLIDSTSQILYYTYIYKLQVPSLCFESSNSYFIHCFTNETYSSREFFYSNTHPPNKLIFLGDFSTSVIGDPWNKQHSKREKINILPALLKDYVEVSSIWHLGDIAYDLYSNDGQRGREFLTEIEDFASKIPYIAVAGNHEVFNNFKDFMSLFADGLYFKKTIGNLNIIAICSEFDFNKMKPKGFPYKEAFLMYLKQKQIKWLENSLKSINREDEPWLMLIAHKPLYCSVDQESEMVKSVCNLQSEIMRTTYEEIIVRYKVDLAIFGHLHLYERTLPIKFGEVVGTFEDYSTFFNPQAPIYVINGVAGNLEAEDIRFEVTETPDLWTVTIKKNLGYGLLTVFNRTHLKYEQIGFGETQWDSIDTDIYPSKKVVDLFWIVKDKIKN